MSNIVRAKFQCVSIKDDGHAKTAEFRAVYSTMGENASFCKSTPNGTIQLRIDNQTRASDFFEPLKEYYVDFSEVQPLEVSQ